MSNSGDGVKDGAQMPFGILRKIAQQNNQTRINADKAAKAITTDFAAQKVKARARAESNQVAEELNG